MAKTKSPSRAASAKRRTPRKSSRKIKARGIASAGAAFRQAVTNGAGMLVLLIVEVTCLVISAAAVVLLLVGAAAHKFSGTDLLGSLLPFLFSVFAISLGLAFCIIFWWRLRGRLNSHSIVLAPLLAVVFAIGGGVLASHERFYTAYGELRTMVGGKSEINRAILSHQIYAAYRRYKKPELLKLIKRAEPYAEDITAAANAYSVDPDLLFGLAAAESSFYPRKSKDGGDGLFQITTVPKDVEEQVSGLMRDDNIVAGDHRYNAFVAAATLKNYMKQMKGDCILGLLAYNIGPANGGLRFIMDKYKAYDFASIQPYLQYGPRHYPVRVLSYALAFKIWNQYGQLINYEKGGNAIRIQKISIPGMDSSCRRS